jgi:hypothetical protein
VIAGTTTSPTELTYTVAPGNVLVVVDVIAFSTVAGPSSGQLFVGGVGTLAYPAGLGLNGLFHETLRCVVNPNETLYASAAAGTLQWMVTGYLLSTG